MLNRSLSKRLKLTWLWFISLLLFAPLVSGKAKSVLDIHQTEIDNGAKLLFVHYQRLPIIRIAVVFRAGSAYDGQQFGLANITNSMLDGGTKQLNINQIANGFAKLGANYSANTTTDMAVVSLLCLTKKAILNPALALFHQVLTEPSFAQNAFNLRRNLLLNDIQAQQQQPMVIADQQFLQTLYGNYPYAHPVIGTTKSLQSLTRASLKTFYHNYYVAKNALVVIVGNVNFKQAKLIAQQILSGLPTGNPAQKLAAPKALQVQKIQLNYPISQTIIRLGELGIKHNNPNYFALKVGNYIFGGSQDSILMNEIRSKQGLTYAISSHFETMSQIGPFVISLQTKSDKAKQAITAIKTALTNYLNKGPTKAQLKTAKDDIIGSFPLQFANSEGIADALITIGFYHLPLTYLDTLPGKITALTTTQVKQALQQTLSTNKLITITVGAHVADKKSKTG